MERNSSRSVILFLVFINVMVAVCFQNCAPVLRVTDDVTHPAAASASSLPLAPALTPPARLHLSQTPNHAEFVVSWTAGVNASTCYLEYQNENNDWTSAPGRENCDADLSGARITLPSSVWSSPDTSRAVRLVRASDGLVLGVFPEALTCVSSPALSTDASPADANCDGHLDDAT